MLRFFRKIRNKLLTDNRFGKYLLYAIGEILLVVIGILIALWIDNWNEEKNQQERFHIVLVDVEKELIDNIRWTRQVIGRLAFTDSLYLKFFVDSVKFENKEAYVAMISQIGGLKTPKDDAFQILKEIKNLKIEQEDLLKELNSLYGAEIYLDRVSNKIYEASQGSYKLFMKYDWYENFISHQWNDERIIDYFINDPEYRKIAIDLFSWNMAYNIQLSMYDNLAIPVYKEVNDYLDSLNIVRSDSLSLEYNPGDFKNYLGKYNYKWSRKGNTITDSVLITIEKDNLSWKDYVSGEIHWNSRIIPINRYRFRVAGKPGVGHIEFDELGLVENLRYSIGPSAIGWWKKVR